MVEKVDVGIFVLSSFSSWERLNFYAWCESSRKRKFEGTFVLWNFRSLHGTFTAGSDNSVIQKFHPNRLTHFK